MAELVYALDLGSSGATHGGSIPPFRTKRKAVRAGGDGQGGTLRIDVTETSASTRRIEIEAPLEELREKSERRIRETLKSASAPGFRKGKIPRAMIEKLYGAQIRADVARSTLDEAFSSTLTERAINPIGPPKVESLDIQESQAARLVALVEVLPDVELGSLSELKLTRAITPTSEADIDRALDQYRERAARFEPRAPDQGARDGDYIVFDIEAKKEDGSELKRFTGSAREAKIDKESMMPEFYNAAIGIKSGQTRSFEALIPKNYPDPQDAGAKALCVMKAHQVKERRLPPLDDDFAKELSEFDTLDQLRADIRASLESSAKEIADMALREELIDRLIEKTTIEEPPEALQRDIQANIEREKAAMSNPGSGEKVSDGKIEERARARAVRQMKERIIVTSYARQKSIQIDQADIDRQIERFAAMFGSSVEAARANLDSDSAREMIRSRALVEKVYAAMLGEVTIVDKEVEAK